MFNTTTNWDEALSTRHISADLGSYEAARTGFFTFIVNDLDNIVKATVAKNDAVENFSGNDVIPKAGEYLRLNVTKAKIPHFSVEVLKYRRGNDEVKFAGVPTFDEGSIEVDDVVGLDTKSILAAWQALTYDVKSRKGGRMRDYKKDCTLIEYTQDYEQIRSWTLYGCFPSDFTEDDFDKENDGMRKISMTIQYDRAEMEMPEVESD